MKVATAAAVAAGGISHDCSVLLLLAGWLVGCVRDQRTPLLPPFVLAVLKNPLVLVCSKTTVLHPALASAEPKRSSFGHALKSYVRLPPTTGRRRGGTSIFV